jgi:hypothetical protein
MTWTAIADSAHMVCEVLRAGQRHWRHVVVIMPVTCWLNMYCACGHKLGLVSGAIPQSTPTHHDRDQPTPLVVGRANELNFFGLGALSTTTGRG